MASTQKKNSGKAQSIPVRMVGTPARTAAITMLLLLIGCGLGGAGFLYFKNNGSLFAYLPATFLTVPPYDDTHEDVIHLSGLNPPDNTAATNNGDGSTTVPQPPPLPMDITIPILPTPDDTTPIPSFAQLPDHPNRKPLPVAPFASLIEKAPGGLLLPRIDEQGKAPWKAYARPFRLPRETVPIAVIVHNLGLSDQATEAAIRKLPPEVTLSFSFGSSNLDYRLRTAREAGHETLIELPLEAQNFPLTDTGPSTLLTTLPFAENEKRLNSILGRAGGYVGVLTPLASRFAASPQIADLMAVIEKRGLLYVGDLASLAVAPPPGLPVANISMQIDRQMFRTAIEASLAQVMIKAQKTGERIVVVLPATPLAMDRLLAWLAEIEKTPNVVLAPISIVARPTRNPAAAAQESDAAAIVPLENTPNAETAPGDQPGTPSP